MNKRTILILLVLAIAVLGFTMGPACAATTTIKIKMLKGYMQLSFTMIRKKGMISDLTLMYLER